ncbi:hypothetical protein QMK33_05870 [Hymenobacter sp. H14-R3]|uniref:hypothetical protein n=1 Tax=Hymenobacter sp. H14-R3 TaxID=3046308 RepID=UPI0024B89DAB|nr:hypothetical protein [Hymenobacter sp. H14-R3]MDJ0364673.1 hypothetical protein [Hymenobacter sp. H14-R3]
MRTQPPILSATAALARLQEGLAVANATIMDKLAPAIGDNWGHPVQFERCVIEDFDGCLTQFTRPVTFTACHFTNCSFVFAYFLQGLVIENCTFDNDLDFQAGGHNSPGYPVVIENCHFLGFVNFFDCWYKGEVIIRDNLFSKGTNIDSKKQLITFDIAPIRLGNNGVLTVEAEEELR